jgi:aminobenzoyl-glutamate utilization protein B
LKAMKNSNSVWDIVEGKREAFFALSDRIWDMPETNYCEYRSAEEHARQLEAEGFRVERGFAGLPTAVMGEAGEGGPVIAILGEFDALPGMSQEAGLPEKREAEPNGNGHGCGHNMLGAGSMLAAAAVKDFLAANGLKGRIRYYGCPAEEGGSSKGFMVRSGVFDDVDIAICWHPATFAGINNPVSLACNELNFHFTGRASHASATPHLGRSALDAVELMNVGVNYMREHMPSTARIHYAVTDTGGHAPNVVQARGSRPLSHPRAKPARTAFTGRPREEGGGRGGVNDGDVRAQRSDQRRRQPRRQPSPRGADVRKPAAAWPPSLRRAGP